MRLHNKIGQIVIHSYNEPKIVARNTDVRNVHLKKSGETVGKTRDGHAVRHFRNEVWELIHNG